MLTPANDDPVVTVVHSDGCHYCEDARDALTAIATEHRLRVQYLDAASPSGADLVSLHRVPMFPLILVDGNFFSYGRLPRRKLIALLRDRAARPAKAGAR